MAVTEGLERTLGTGYSPVMERPIYQGKHMENGQARLVGLIKIFFLKCVSLDIE